MSRFSIRDFHFKYEICCLVLNVCDYNSQGMETSQSVGSEPSMDERVVSTLTGSAMDLDDNAVEDEEAEQADLLNEDELRELLKVNSNKCIEHMRISPKEASRFDIPLCRLVYMPLVRPTLASDIKRLEAEFTHGYRAGASVFYVSICNERGEERSVSSKDMKDWNDHWKDENTWFESRLLANPHLKYLHGKMFFVCGGNHRLKAWTGFISRMHNGDRDWHISVDAICLDTRGKTALLLNAMHDINK
jgi:hypothetical protein